CRHRPFGVVRRAMAVRGVLVVATLAILTVDGASERASAAWVVDSRGQCVEQWSPASMLRGPTAMLMAPTAPFRSGAGVFAYETTEGKVGFWGPPVAVLAGVVGVIGTGVWLDPGFAETLSRGYFPH